MAAAKSVYERFGASTLTGTDQTARKHTYKGGETMSAIAAYEFATGYDSEVWRQLAEYNAIDDLDAITVGKVLTLPVPNPTT